MNKINDGSRILVFCETKRGVDEVTRKMRCDGWHSVRGIHGDRTQMVIIEIVMYICAGKRLSDQGVQTGVMYNSGSYRCCISRTWLGLYRI